jgi:hypothetical protein
MRGRRAVLAGAAAAGAGAAAGLAGRAGVTSAAPASPAPVLLGRANTETSATSVSNARGTALSAATSGNGERGVAGTDESTNGGYGVSGSSTNGIGVAGISTNGTGVYGAASALNQAGVNGIDISGNIISGGGYGVLAKSAYGYALYAEGDAAVTTNLSVLGSLFKGSGSFKIDHPLDPARKYLYHSFVESPDMKNVYDGTVTLDQDGRAAVALPNWFEALNRDYRYQLTPIGGPAPRLHIAAKVAGGQFAIAGGTPGQEVPWQVTGIRRDAWANAHRIPVEETKPAEDQGRYLHPEPHHGEPITVIARARAAAERHRSAGTASQPVGHQAAGVSGPRIQPAPENGWTPGTR